MSRRALAAAALALGLAWLTAPGVPLYDGIGFPDEPYRYVDRPAGAKATKPPTSALREVAASKGAAAFFDAQSHERGPQIDIYATSGALRGSAGVRSFTVRADPIAPGATGPAGGYIDGNIYRIALTSTPAGPVTVAPATTKVSAWVALRATSSSPGSPIFLYRPNPATAWRDLTPKQTGNDVFATAVVGPGDYALAYLHKARPGGRGGGLPLTVIVLSIALGLVLIAVAGIRIARSRDR